MGPRREAVSDRLRGGKDAGDGQRLRHRADLHLFAIPRAYQHRVLFWGILGVIVLRGIMIGLGATLVAQYHWVLYIFAAFLIFTGIKMLVTDDQHIDIAEPRAAHSCAGG
jgi:predicted tellurium resistance membrane protein TerC